MTAPLMNRVIDALALPDGRLTHRLRIAHRGEPSRHPQPNDHMPGYMKVVVALSVGLLGVLLGNAKPLTAAEQNPVTAIDIVLEPDATMTERALAANERLLEVFPKGFALGKTHAPHISTLQRYVRTADLDKIYEAVSKVLAEEKPADWKLKATSTTTFPGRTSALPA